MRRWVRLCIAVLLVLAPVLVAVETAASAPSVPFGARFQTNDNGMVTTIGNGLETCPAAAANCVAARAGTARLNNNGFAMVNLDADTDPTTVNSSAADLTLPAGGGVLWAGLYWGARVSGGTGGRAGVGDRRTMDLKVPAGAYTDITSQAEFGPTSGDLAYQEFADVTAQVRAGGAGRYWGANVVAGTGEDRYAGWSLVVVVRDPTQPLRNLTVFDGFADVGQGNPQSVTINGFLAPRTGSVDAQIGLVAYEGDYSTSGDTASLNSTQLGTMLSPGSNFFNGTDDDRGKSVTARDPADLNMLGFDIKNVGASGVIPNSATSATLALTSTGDRYFPGVVTTAINLYAPDFSPSTKSVSDLAGNDPALPGDTLRYTVSYANRGGDPAASSVMTDPLPAGTTYVPGSLRVVTGANSGTKTDAPDGDQAEFDTAADAVRFRLGAGANGTTGGVLDPGAESTVTFDVTVDGDAGGTTITNTSSLRYIAQTVGAPFTYDVRPVSMRVAALADLSLTKDLTPDPTLAGQPATATITVHNAGPSAAREVVLSDPTPDGVTLTRATTTVGTCSIAGGDVGCDLGTLGNGATATVTVTLTVPPGSTATSVADLASVTSSTDDPDLGNNSAGAAVGVEAAADISVTKTATPTMVTPGGTVTYQVAVHNAGPSDARNAVFDDDADPATMQLTVITPAAACGNPSASFTAVRCTLGSLAPGSTRTFTVTGTMAPNVDAGTTSVNRATVSSDTPDPDLSDDTAAATVTAGAPRADLHIQKTADPTTVIAGRQVIYTITVDNDAGPSDAAGVVVRDPMPSGFTATSATSTRGTCTVGGTVVCDIGDLVAGTDGAAGASATITITADVAAAASAGSVSNIATASGPGADAVSATAPVTVVTRADLDIHKSASASPTQDGARIVAGGEAYFTMVATNHGPSTAQAVRVTDQLSPAFTFVSAIPSAGTCESPGAGGLLTCTVPSLADRGTVTVVVHMHVPSSYDGSDAPDTARVSSATTDPAPADNDATYTVSGGAEADLVLTKTAAPDPIVAGDTVTYTLRATNLGPSDATGVVVVDDLPTGLSFTDAVPDECTTTGQHVSCTAGGVAAGDTATFEIIASVSPILESGATITNDAHVSSGVDDPSPDNNSANVTSDVRTSSDIAITKAQIAPSTPPGGHTAFSLTVVNHGPSVARDVTVIDSADVEAAVQVIPDGACDTLNGALQCAVGDLAPGETKEIDLVLGVVSYAAAGTYHNTAVVGSSTTEIDETNNASTIAFDVTDPVAILRVAKKADPSTFVDGSTFSYDVTVTPGPEDPSTAIALGSDAHDVVVTDTLPAGLVPNAATTTQGACSVAGQTVTCRLGVVRGILSATDVGPITITVTGAVVTSLDADSVTNTATLTSSTPLNADSVPSASVTTPVTRQAVLELTKTADADPVIAGSVVNYTVTVTNSGPSDAASVLVTDPLPAALTFDPDASDPLCTGVNAVIRCDLGTIASGDSRSFVVAGCLSPSYDGTTLTNTATAVSPTDPDPATATDNSRVERQAVLTLAKTADSLTPSVGTEFDYNIEVTNTGPSTATEVTVSDSLPDAFTVVSTNATVGSCTNSGAPTRLRCALGTLAVGASAVVTVRVRIPDGSRPGPVTNDATARADDADEVGSAVSVSVVVVADTSVTKTLLTDPVVPGRPVTYRLTASNSGPASAPDVVLSDALPAGTRLLRATSNAGPGCSTGTEGSTVLLECQVGALAVGVTASATVTLATSSSLRGTLSNTALVGSGGLDPDTVRNLSTARAKLGAPAPPSSTPPSSTPASTSAPASGTPSRSPSPGSATQPTTGAEPAATSPGGSSAGLAGTGVDVARGIAVGLLATALGVGLVWAARRRRGAHGG